MSADSAPPTPTDTAALFAAAESRREAKTSGAEEGGASAERELQLILFDVGKEHFAVPLESVTKIERVPKIVPVPRTPAFIRGIASLRGEITPVVDLRLLLARPAGEAAAPCGLVVIQAGGRKAGVLSDSVPDFLRETATLSPPLPGPGTEVLAGVIDYFDEETIAIIVPERLFDTMERRM
jgi:purine-binding chemotaxis protein CheW